MHQSDKPCNHGLKGQCECPVYMYESLEACLKNRPCVTKSKTRSHQYTLTLTLPRPGWAMTIDKYTVDGLHGPEFVTSAWYKLLESGEKGALHFLVETEIPTGKTRHYFDLKTGLSLSAHPLYSVSELDDNTWRLMLPYIWR